METSNVTWAGLEEYLQAPGICANAPVSGLEPGGPTIALHRRSSERPLDTAADLIATAVKATDTVPVLIDHMDGWMACSSPERRNVLETAEMVLQRVAPREALRFRAHLDNFLDPETRLERDLVDAFQAFAAEHYLHELEGAGGESLNVRTLEGVDRDADPAKSLHDSFWKAVHNDDGRRGSALTWTERPVEAVTESLARRLAAFVKNAAPAVRPKHRLLAARLDAEFRPLTADAIAYQVKPSVALSCCGSVEHVFVSARSSFLVQFFAWC